MDTRIKIELLVMGKFGLRHKLPYDDGDWGVSCGSLILNLIKI